MTDGIKFNIEGLKDTNKKLKGLGVGYKYKGSRFAMRKAANFLAGKVKENAQRVDDPDTETNIAANIVVRFSPRRFKRNGDVMFRVGVLGGARQTSKPTGNPGGDTFHWRFLEFGTSKTQARPFMRPAMEANVSKISGEFVTHLNKWTDRNIRRIERLAK